MPSSCCNNGAWIAQTGIHNIEFSGLKINYSAYYRLNAFLEGDHIWLHSITAVLLFVTSKKRFSLKALRYLDK
jgi:plasmid replication initiation protein